MKENDGARILECLHGGFEHSIELFWSTFPSFQDLDILETSSTYINPQRSWYLLYSWLLYVVRFILVSPVTILCFKNLSGRGYRATVGKDYSRSLYLIWQFGLPKVFIQLEQVRCKFTHSPPFGKDRQCWEGIHWKNCYGKDVRKQRLGQPT